MKWKRVHQGPINEPIIEYLEKLIVAEQEKGNKLKVAVGTDSQRRGRGYKYATVIILVSEGKGGKVMVTTDLEKGIPTINERMLKEVYKSIEIAYEICPLLDLYDVPLEVHADINTDPMHGSNVALKQAIGYIQGMGYTFKVKPEAFASSNCADDVCHH